MEQEAHPRDHWGRGATEISGSGVAVHETYSFLGTLADTGSLNHDKDTALWEREYPLDSSGGERGKIQLP